MLTVSGACDLDTQTASQPQGADALSEALGALGSEQVPPTQLGGEVRSCASVGAGALELPLTDASPSPKGPSATGSQGAAPETAGGTDGQCGDGGAEGPPETLT